MTGSGMAAGDRARSLLYLLFGLSLAISVSAAQAIGAVLVIDALMGLKTGRVRRFASPLDLALVAYVIWGVASGMWAGSVSLRKALTTQDAVLAFYLLAHAASGRERVAAVKGFLWGSVAVSVLAVLQFASGAVFDPDHVAWTRPAWMAGFPDPLVDLLSVRNGRAVGTRSHPLTFAESLLPAFFVFSTGLFLKLNPLPLRRGAAATGWILVSAGLVLASGRGVWLGAGAGVVMLAVLLRRRLNGPALAAAAVAAAIVFAATPSLRTRVLSIVTRPADATADLQSRDMRFVLWRGAWDAFLSRPVTGVGLKGLSVEAPDPRTGAPRDWSEAHNVYLQNLAERGAVGFLLLIWALAAWGRVAARAPAPWNGVLFGLLTAFLVAGLSESWLRDKEVALIFWAAAGVAANLRRAEESRRAG